EALAEEAVDIFASIMTADPLAIALTGNDLSMIPDLARALIRALLLTPGVSQMWTARDETGVLAGYTMFALPGQLMLSTDEQMKNARFMEFLERLSPEAQSYFNNTMGKEFPKVNNEAFGIESSERTTYWCNFAMVRAEHQGKGIAKALFKLAFEQADKLGAPVALSTTNIRNVPIYEKIGFRHLEERVMQSPWIEWHLWFFIKDAATSGSADGEYMAAILSKNSKVRSAYSVSLICEVEPNMTSSTIPGRLIQSQQVLVFSKLLIEMNRCMLRSLRLSVKYPRSPYLWEVSTRLSKCKVPKHH
ncbi:hypothetical protein C8Q80DRAFT_1111112, partial [Daedaleopsis nitida]